MNLEPRISFEFVMACIDGPGSKAGLDVNVATDGAVADVWEAWEC